MNNENTQTYDEETGELKRTETVRQGHVSFEVKFELSQDDLTLMPLEYQEIIDELREELETRIRGITSDSNYSSYVALNYDIEATITETDSMLWTPKTEN